MFHLSAKVICQSDFHVILGAQFEVRFFFAFEFASILLLGKSLMRNKNGHFHQRALFFHLTSSLPRAQRGPGHTH